MRSAAATLMIAAGSALAHPGHGAPEGHLHGLGMEHLVLLIVVVGFLIYAQRGR